MDPYFIDTSALVKNYHREHGSSIVERLFAESGTRRLISRLALVELESMLARKVRANEIGPHAVLAVRQRLEFDLARGILTAVGLRDQEFVLARQLVMQYGAANGLRTLDALHLAAALTIHRDGFGLMFVSADRILCAVSAAVGLPVINPEDA